jgi:hypothetical protein
MPGLLDVHLLEDHLGDALRGRVAASRVHGVELDQRAAVRVARSGGISALARGESLN